MCEMWRRKPDPTLLSTQGIFNLPQACYQSNWPLMTLYIIHSREMDCSTATCYSSDWDSFCCLQGHLPHGLTNRAIFPPLGDWGIYIMWLGYTYIYKRSCLSSCPTCLCLQCFVGYGRCLLLLQETSTDHLAHSSSESGLQSAHYSTVCCCSSGRGFTNK